MSVLPLASTRPSAPICVCPAPSATTTSACWCFRSFRSTWSRIDGTSNSDSGMRQRSTSPEASVACMAMKPLWRPMSLTTPTPFGHAAASVAAATMWGTAASTAVANPKDLSMTGTSLSMVFGTTATAHLRPRRAISASTLHAPFIVPSPPTRKSMFTPAASKASQMADVSWPPRDDRSTVPPRAWMPSTKASSRRTPLFARSLKPA
mmetsp:Transcript_29720/g.101066  ORF Transcript_29720/g.101066 Transcript_29720/m.101066 type:complete len:207 (+) Transcript_29720:496-1116(+)